MPDGNVFQSGPTPDMHIIDVNAFGANGQGTMTKTNTHNDWYLKHGVTIMYDEGKLITAGGWTDGENKNSSNKAITIDLNGPSPTITPIASMTHARKFHNGVMLPNGEMVVIGGNTNGLNFDDSTAVRQTEIWNPTTQQWRLGASQVEARTYHSVAILMLDGRVFSGGGGLCAQFNCPEELNHPNHEIYTPPYLFNPDGTPAMRPVILSVPSVVETGQTINITATAGLQEFSLIKMSGTTHAVNTDLRYLKAPVTAGPSDATEVTPGNYQLTLHTNTNVLTPGNWMLFALNTNGTPSIAKVINVSTQGLVTGAPTIKSMGGMKHDLGESVNINIVAGDPDGDALTYTATGLPDGLMLNAASGVITGTPTQIGVYATTITVDDSTQGTDATSFLWNIAEVTSEPGVEYKYFEDEYEEVPDLTGVTPLATGVLDNIVILGGFIPEQIANSYAYQFDGQINIGELGTYTFYSNSNHGSKVFINGQLVVNNDYDIFGPNGGDPQEGSGAVVLSKGLHDIQVVYFINEFVPNSPVLEVSYEGPGFGKQLIPNAVLSQPAAVPPPPNNPPVVTNPGNQANNTGDTVNLQIVATDADGDSLTYSASQLPTGVTINTASGLISGIPTAGGSYSSIVSVTDGKDPVNINFTWDVTAVNNAPTVTNPGNQTSTVSDVINLPITANDIDGDTLTYTATGLPNGLAIDLNSGLITGTLIINGQFNVVVSVNDGTVSTDAAFQWNVLELNLPPALNAVADQTNFQGDTVSLQLSATDPNNDPITYSATGLPTGLNINAQTGLISGQPTITGSYAVTATASDGLLDNSQNFNWTVNAPIIPIVITPMTSAPVQTGLSIDYTATATGSGPLEYRWFFGDGTNTPFSTDPNVSHTFTSPGRSLVTLVVRNPYEQVTTVFTQAVHLPPVVGQAINDTTMLYESATGTPRIWNVNPDNDTVTVIDTALRTKITEISVGDNPSSLAIESNSNEIWVVNKFASTISRISLNTLTVVGVINLPVNSRPHGLVINSNANLAYVALESLKQIIQLNILTGLVSNTLSIGNDVKHLSLSADGSVLYAPVFRTPPIPGENTGTPSTLDQNNNLVGGLVNRILTGSFTLDTSIVVPYSNATVTEHAGPGLPNYMRSLVISPDGINAYIQSKQDNILAGTLRSVIPLDHDHTVRGISSHIDLLTGTSSLTNRIDHDNSSTLTAAAYGPYGSYLFVAMEGNRMVSVVDAYGGEEIFRFITGRAPHGLVVSPDGTELFVHNFLDRTVTIHDISPIILQDVNAQTQVASINLVANEQLTAQILLGKQHFYDALDPRLALESYMSCASCHSDGDDDGRIWDFTQFGEGLRNTTTLRGQAGASRGPVHWTGNFDEIQDFEGQIRNFAKGLGLMDTVDFNVGTRSQSLGDPKAGISPDLDALAAYLESLNQVDASPFKAGNGQLTANALLGQQLFIGHNCTNCHGGANYSDSAIDVRHDVGTIDGDSGGRMGGVLDGFDTPTLKGLWMTAPYMHDGSATTITEAILAHTSIVISTQDANLISEYLLQLDETVGPLTDTDNDTVIDSIDNCVNHANTDQRDTDNDGTGNRCDADINNDNLVDMLDSALVRAALFTTNGDADFDGNGTVDFNDMAIFRTLMFEQTGSYGSEFNNSIIFWITGP